MCTSRRKAAACGRAVPARRPGGTPGKENQREAWLKLRERTENAHFTFYAIHLFCGINEGALQSFSSLALGCAPWIHELVQYHPAVLRRTMPRLRCWPERGSSRTVPRGPKGS